MASSFRDFVFPGGSPSVDVTMGYLSKNHINVYVGGVLVDPSTYTWNSDAQIQLASAPVAGTTGRVQRVTPTNPLTNFQPGNIDASDLNNAELQALYVAVESRDASDDIYLRGWYTAGSGSGGLITKGSSREISTFDSAGNIVPSGSNLDVILDLISDAITQGGGVVPIYSTSLTLPSATISGGINAIWLNGWLDVADGLGGLFVATNTGSLDFASSRDGRVWYRVSDDRDKAFLALQNRKLLADVDYKLSSGAAFGIVCQGDSLTEGKDETSGDIIPAPIGIPGNVAPITYPQRLASQLAAMTNNTITVINQGYPGDTAALSFARWPTKPSANVAFLMLGTNDSRGGSGATLAQYRTYMELIIQRFIHWGIGVVVMTPPATQFNNAEVAPAQYGQWAKALGKAYGCPVFESVEVHQYCLYGEVYSDTTHFNKYGYAKLGDAVTAFLLSGALVDMRRVSSDSLFTAIRGTEGIGAFRKGSTFGTTTSGSYVSTDFAMGISENGAYTMAYYLDAEAADIYLAGDLAGCVINPSFPVASNVAVNRSPLKRDRQVGVDETQPYTAPAYIAGGKTYAGTHVGRGWKLFQIKGKATGGGNVFFNEVFIEPKTPREAAVVKNLYRPAVDELIAWQSPAGSGGLPTAVVIDGDAVVRLPKCFWGRVVNNQYYFGYGIVRATIKAVGLSAGSQLPGITEVLLYRTNSSNTLTIDVVWKTNSSCIVPVAAGIGYTPYNSSLIGPTGLDKTRQPVGIEAGWLYLTFAGSSMGYYEIEFRSMAIADADATMVY